MCAKRATSYLRLELHSKEVLILKKFQFLDFSLSSYTVKPTFVALCQILRFYLYEKCYNFDDQ